MKNVWQVQMNDITIVMEFTNVVIFSAFGVRTTGTQLYIIRRPWSWGKVTVWTISGGSCFSWGSGTSVLTWDTWGSPLSGATHNSLTRRSGGTWTKNQINKTPLLLNTPENKIENYVIGTLLYLEFRDSQVYPGSLLRSLLALL